jgi:hypothetical protein
MRPTAKLYVMMCSILIMDHWVVWVSGVEEKLLLREEEEMVSEIVQCCFW